MKLTNCLIGLFLLGTFASCSNEDGFTNEQENNTKGDSFMAINVVAPNTGTKAFEDGDPTESEVGSAIFFFFKADGSSAFPAITPEPTLNFKPDAPDGSNITKISDAIIVFNSKDGKAVPNSMVAILNPSSEIAGLKTPTLTELKTKVESSHLNASQNGKFIMSNSTYVGNNNTVITETPITASNIFTKEADATEKPLNVYVERLAAKVTTTNKIIVDPEVGNLTLLDGVSGSVKIKLSDMKWDIVTTNPESHLLKQVSPAWAFDPVWSWNDPTNFRSYWANSKVPTEYTNKSFDKILLGSGASTYCLENTNPNKTTKLLVSGFLTYEDGTKLDLMEWGGLKFTPDGMKTQIANMVEYYTRTGDGTTPSPYVYTRIGKEHITFTRQGATNQYQVVANINDGIYYTLLNNQGTLVSVADINKALVKLGNIKHWNGGRTYYFVDINHSHGEPGVVRNHVYKLAINSVSGLGTPVPDEKEVIIPVIPEDDQSYIAASVNILAWKVVTQDVDLK